MADISFHCPKCSTKLKIDAAAAGYFINCPRCQERLQIPDASGQAAASATTPMPVPGGAEFKFRCPECQGKLKMDRNDAGRSATCPHCSKMIRIPELPVAGAPARCPRAGQGRPVPVTR